MGRGSKHDQEGKTMIDFEYITNGFWVSVMPISQDGAVEYANLVEQGFDGKVFLANFDTFKFDLKSNGYTIRKARKVNISDDDLLAELGA
jgi:hypothetical protein